MQSCFGKYSGHLFFFGILFLVIQSSVATGQESKKFASSGVFELGGSISYENITSVVNGESGDAIHILIFSPYAGYFVADGLELGIQPAWTSIARSDFTSEVDQISLLVAPAFNFHWDDRAFPFVEALLGYTAVSATDDSTRRGFTYGGRMGIKGTFEKAILSVSVQYLRIAMNPEGAVNRYGSNTMTVFAGFTVWL